MDVKHPKRKRDSENPYTLSIENGIKYITFEDSHGHIQTMEISPALFALFDEFELDDISYMNVVSRHHEHSELTEQSLNDRAFQLPESMEDTVFRKMENETLMQAIRTLPMVQRRRLVLYYFHDLTYEQIAKIEHCTIMPVKRSIDRAIIKLRQILS